jgi:hypothetical protein
MAEAHRREAHLSGALAERIAVHLLTQPELFRGGSRETR